MLPLGDQAEIVFTLIGEPPFTFTYQRAEISLKKGTAGKVLETHTVSRVQTKAYSIFSALEGWLGFIVSCTPLTILLCRYMDCDVNIGQVLPLSAYAAGAGARKAQIDLHTLCTIPHIK